MHSEDEEGPPLPIKDMYTLEEVASTKDTDEPLMVVAGRVIRLKHLLPEHPGGSDVLLPLAGSDATELFIDMYHSRDAMEQMMGEYCVGRVQGMPQAPPEMLGSEEEYKRWLAKETQWEKEEMAQQAKMVYWKVVLIPVGARPGVTGLIGRYVHDKFSPNQSSVGAEFVTKADKESFAPHPVRYQLWDIGSTSGTDASAMRLVKSAHIVCLVCAVDNVMYEEALDVCQKVAAELPEGAKLCVVGSKSDLAKENSAGVASLKKLAAASPRITRHVFCSAKESRGATVFRNLLVGCQRDILRAESLTAGKAQDLAAHDTTFEPSLGTLHVLVMAESHVSFIPFMSSLDKAYGHSGSGDGCKSSALNNYFQKGGSAPEAPFVVVANERYELYYATPSRLDHMSAATKSSVSFHSVLWCMHDTDTASVAPAVPALAKLWSERSVRFRMHIDVMLPRKHRLQNAVQQNRTVASEIEASAAKHLVSAVRVRDYPDRADLALVTLRRRLVHSNAGEAAIHVSGRGKCRGLEVFTKGGKLTGSLIAQDIAQVVPHVRPGAIRLWRLGRPMEHREEVENVASPSRDVEFSYAVVTPLRRGHCVEVDTGEGAAWGGHVTAVGMDGSVTVKEVSGGPRSESKNVEAAALAPINTAHLARVPVTWTPSWVCWEHYLTTHAHEGVSAAPPSCFLTAHPGGFFPRYRSAEGPNFAPMELGVAELVKASQRDPQVLSVWLFCGFADSQEGSPFLGALQKHMAAAAQTYPHWAFFFIDVFDPGSEIYIQKYTHPSIPRALADAVNAVTDKKAQYAILGHWNPMPGADSFALPGLDPHALHDMLVERYCKRLDEAPAS
eukprot:TRINITY_DN6006_c0_g1_i2.p1 TRINITY_DN6006_c0_g1~~TRINITY_DN6006_c0_g1_i2.p1  ORF type:complete len:841 (+),score=64.86 TRINITY_DN6006_c0_g1_i2:82-2604(+)